MSTPIKLGYFKFVAHCFDLIDRDSRGFDWQPAPRDWTVPKKWLPKFRVAERVLNSIGEKTLGDLKPQAAFYKFYQFDIVERKTLAMELIAVPVDDIDVDLLRAAKCSEKEIKTVQEIMESFFDGEIADLLYYLRTSKTAATRSIDGKLFRKRSV